MNTGNTDCGQPLYIIGGYISTVFRKSIQTSESQTVRFRLLNLHQWDKTSTKYGSIYSRNTFINDL